jgi:hypothetical protein
MPHQGVLFIPTYSRTEPRIYFGLVDTPPDELAMSDRGGPLQDEGGWRIQDRGASGGDNWKHGYIYPAGEKYALIVRNCFVNPLLVWRMWRDHVFRDSQRDCHQDRCEELRSRLCTSNSECREVRLPRSRLLNRVEGGSVVSHNFQSRPPAIGCER